MKKIIFITIIFTTSLLNAQVIDLDNLGISINLSEILQAINDSASPLFITNPDLIDSLETTNWDQTTYGYYTGNMSYFPADSGVFYADSSFFVINNGTTMIKALLSGGGGTAIVVDTVYFNSNTSGEYITYLGNIIKIYINDAEIASFETSGLNNNYTVNRPSFYLTAASSNTNAVFRTRKNYNTGQGGTYTDVSLIDEGTEVLRTNTDSTWILGYFVCDSILSLKAGVFSDYVFKDDYYLTPFSKEIKWIKENKHLRSLQKEDGNKLITDGQIQRRLEGAIEEIEKLYLYIERQNKDLFRIKIIFSILGILLTGLTAFVWLKKQ